MSRSALQLATVAVLAVALAAGCSDTATIPPETRLVANLTAELDPDSVSVGDSVSAELAGNLEAGDRVLLEKGTPIHGTVTALQESEGRWPAVVNLDFTSLEVAGERHVLSSRVASAEARVRGGEDGSEAATGDGLIGSVAEGRSGAALVRPQVQKEPGTSVVVGTEADSGFLPAGARIELVVTELLEVPSPDR